MKQITVTGMSCGHCASAVSNALKDLGLSNVTVNLVGGIAAFDATESVTEEQVRGAVSEAGFEVASIL